jgi:uncharacterized delta-60 repeat protein
MKSVLFAPRALLAGLLLAVGATAPARGGPGDLDVRFGIHGQAEVPGQIDSAALVALPDGRILVFGIADGAAVRDAGAFAVTRLLVDGSFDPGFGSGGYRNIPLGSGSGPVPTDALLLPDGQVLVAGRFSGASDTNEPGWLVRLSGDGDIDPGFGVDGIARAGPGGINRIVRLSDGAFAVSSRGLLGRLDPDGAPVVFPGSQQSVLAIGGYPVSALALMADGGLLMTGDDNGWGGWGGFELYRVSPSGPAQLNWGSSRGGSGFTQIGAFARDANDPRVTACGSESSALLVRRWHDDGTPDPTFAATSGGLMKLGEELRPDHVAEYWTEVHCGGLLPGPAGDRLVIGDLNRPFEWGGGRVLLAHLDASGSAERAFDPSGQGRLVALGNPDQWRNWYVIDTALAPDGSVLLIARSVISPAEGPLYEGATHTVVARVEVSASRTSAGSVGFGDAAVRIAERKPGELRVYRTGGSSGSVSVRYEMLAGTAGTADVVLPAGTLTWADGDASPRTIPLDVINDEDTEGEESFRVRLSTPTGGVALSAPEIEVTIEDDEALAALHMSASAARLLEGQFVDVEVTRTGATPGPVVVHYAIADELDPQGVPRPSQHARLSRAPVGELRWSGADISSRTLRVYANGSSAVQPDETGYVVLADAAGTLPAAGGWKALPLTVVDDPSLGQSNPPPPPPDPSEQSGGGGGCGLELSLLAVALASNLRRRAAARPRAGATPRPMHARGAGAATPLRPVPGNAGCF